MIVLGIDASTKSTGWAVFDNFRLVEYGCIKAKNKEWRNRLIEQKPTIDAIIKKYHPEIVSMEDVPLNANSAKILVMLGAVQGFFYGIFSHYGIKVNFVNPSAWRSPLGLFNGKRDGTTREELKKKSIEKANSLFGTKLKWVSPNSTMNDDDISDAILVGYYEVWRLNDGQ